jgi:hypothetical protein
MAKVKFGAMVADARGKHNGVVFSRGPFGAFARAKVSPVQPRGNRQTLVRERVGTLSKRWSGVLTQTQRNAWIAFAASLASTNVFGDRTILSGIQAYTKLNGILLNAGQSIIDTPPTDLGLTGLSSITATAAAGTAAFDIAFTPTPAAANTSLYVSASPQLSPGRTFTESFLRFVKVGTAAQASPLSILTEYTAKFGSLIAGKKIGIRVAIVHFQTGALSPGITQIVTVAP